MITGQAGMWTWDANDSFALLNAKDAAQNLLTTCHLLRHSPALPRSDRCGKGLTACQNTAVTQSLVMYKLAHGGNMFASQVVLYNAYDWHRHNIPFTAMH